MFLFEWKQTHITELNNRCYGRVQLGRTFYFFFFYVVVSVEMYSILGVNIYTVLCIIYIFFFENQNECSNIHLNWLKLIDFCVIRNFFHRILPVLQWYPSKDHKQKQNYAKQSLETYSYQWISYSWNSHKLSMCV